MRETDHHLAEEELVPALHSQRPYVSFQQYDNSNTADFGIGNIPGFDLRHPLDLAHPAADSPIFKNFYNGVFPIKCTERQSPGERFIHE